MLSKFWLRACDQVSPCSWQSAASLMSGSQKSRHSQAASHSLRHELHPGLRLASSCERRSCLQASTQNSGSLRQFDRQESRTSAEAPCGQKICRQLAAEPADGCKAPLTTVLPPQGMTSARFMASVKAMPRCSACVSCLEVSARHLPTGGSSSVLAKRAGQSQDGGAVSADSIGSQRPMQMGVSTVALLQVWKPVAQELMSQVLEVRFHAPFGDATAVFEVPRGLLASGAVWATQSGVLRSPMSRRSARPELPGQW
mmetsp:Transcript_19434/g.56413  ORF Transcript_19434/g.56413 Transcript_19434/m.56413 type:complete len:256 (+) Transcript_19434:2012-2779(+)